MTTLQWMNPYLRVYEQHKLDLIFSLTVHKIGGQGMEGELGMGLGGEGVEYIKIHYIKFSKN